MANRKPKQKLPSKEITIIEQKRAMTMASLILKRGEMKQLHRAIVLKDQDVTKIEKQLHSLKSKHGQLLSGAEERLAKANSDCDRAHNSKEDLNVICEDLHEVIANITNELEHTETIMHTYNKYKNIVIKFLPQSDAVCSLSGETPGQTSAQNINPEMDDESLKLEQRLKKFLSDPKQFVDQNQQLVKLHLVLCQSVTRNNETLKEFRLQTEKTVNACNVEEEKLISEINELNDQIKRVKERAGQLKVKVQLHDSILKDDMDSLLEALGVKVTVAYCTIVDTRLNTLDTLEKMTSIEHRMFRLFDQLDKVPEEALKEMRQKRHIEMMIRLREEELRLKLEKEREREEKCMQRCLAANKPIKRKKLMFRSMHIEKQEEEKKDDLLEKYDPFVSLEEETQIFNKWENRWRLGSPPSIYGRDNFRAGETSAECSLSVNAERQDKDGEKTLHNSGTAHFEELGEVHLKQNHCPSISDRQESGSIYGTEDKQSTTKWFKQDKMPLSNRVNKRINPLVNRLQSSSEKTTLKRQSRTQLAENYKYRSKESRESLRALAIKQNRYMRQHFEFKGLLTRKT